MVSKLRIFSFLVLVSLIGSAQAGSGQETFDKKHLEVALRKIGHQVLLISGDSTSIVMPIKVEGNQYTIQLASEFGFSPEILVLTVSRVMKEANVQSPYILEVIECQSLEVVYSFEINNAAHRDIVTCTSREQPKACYTLLITFSETPRVLTSSIISEQEAKTNLPMYVVLLTGVLGLLVIGSGAYWLKKSRSTIHADVVKLGKFRFDTRNSVLIMAEQKTELTGKEAELLQLLHSYANSPVKREDMLHKVWGDEGNYIGRTLDVFISKLRTKLQADPAVKIVNIHGVGYKLVIDE
jgi:DNA-binding winged helix-turn-helix (wHTH) protein